MNLSNIKNLQFANNHIDIDLEPNVSKANLDNKVVINTCLKPNSIATQEIDVNTFNSLVKFNTHANSFTIHEHKYNRHTRRRAHFNLNLLNDNW